MNSNNVPPRRICSSYGVGAACMRAHRVGVSIVFTLAIFAEIYQTSEMRIKRGTPSWQAFSLACVAKIRISERKAKFI